jgi:hypothetical protein
VKRPRTRTRGASSTPTMTRTPETTTTPPSALAGPDWDAFHPVEYWKANYAYLRGDDKRFLQLLRDFFGAEPPQPGRVGVDVGAGANLYPALAMLPLCERITLLEYGAKNCEWLRGEVQRYSTYWDPFWRVLRENPAYQALGNNNARRPLSRAATVRQGSLFDLEPQQFDVGTMFFVAESITDQADRFYEAVDRFIGSLRPGAPFAAAFMRNSSGYVVDSREFPALEIDENHVREHLVKVAPDLRVETVDTRGQFVHEGDASDSGKTRLLRHGYDGMILALGHIKKA